MPFDKDAEIKVFKDEEGVGSKNASEGESNRYTVDDLVRDSDSSVVEHNNGDDEDVSTDC